MKVIAYGSNGVVLQCNDFGPLSKALIVIDELLSMGCLVEWWMVPSVSLYGPNRITDKFRRLSMATLIQVNTVVHRMNAAFFQRPNKLKNVAKLRITVKYKSICDEHWEGKCDGQVTN